MKSNKQRERIFFDRYALVNRDGQIVETTISDMQARVACHVTENAYEAKMYAEAMSGFGFVPGGRILSGAHNGHQSATLYNCFVIGLHDNDGVKGNDSRKAIMDTVARMVEINARGGGVGINWSTLRPEGSYIHGVHGISSGPNSWMRGADALADQIRQGGSRTAALMFMLDDWHPDAVEFANINKRFSRANFSMSISDDFMERVRKGGDWQTIFPDTQSLDYNPSWDGDIRRWIKNGFPIVEHDCIGARDMWRDIAKSAWALGSPGVVFMDRCNRLSNTRYIERLVGTNPCGEQPLPEDGCCNLGSINLPAFWDPSAGSIDYEELGTCVDASVRFLDRVIDSSPMIDSKIHAEQYSCRRVGLGTMGLADLLILMQIRYGSLESLREISRIYGAIRDQAYVTSAFMAKERGQAPAYHERFMDGEFISTLGVEARAAISELGIRNLSLMTQAPTGTTSTLAGVSSGIEPVFMSTYMRSDATGCHRVVHPLFEGVHHVDDDWLVTAHDITPERHIAVQSAVQRFVDSSVSKTINLPDSATVEDIMKIYEMAYDRGCKGITVYRDGSLEGVMTKIECEACSL